MRLKKIGECDGQAMVEFALMLPVMLILLLGVLEFSLVYNAKLAVTNASRQAARVAAVGQDDPDVKAVAMNSAFTITILEENVLVNPSLPSYEPAATPPLIRPRGTNVTVTVSYDAQLPFFSSIIGTFDKNQTPQDPKTFRVEAKTVMRVE